MLHCKRIVRFLITILIMLTAVDIIAQETPSNGFPIGAFIASKRDEERHSTAAWNSVDSSGMNTFIQYADETTAGHLADYNAIGLNNDFPQDKIYWYALGYYSVWEAENPGDISRTGFVHKSGRDTTWRGVNCWTNDTTAPACSLLYGPHYKQDKDSKDFNERVHYKARYWLALDYDSALVDPNTEVCSLYVTERYTKVFNNTWTGPFVDILGTRALKVSDFYGSSGNFKKFEIDYEYPTKFEDKALEKVKPSPVDTVYSDVDDDNGVEFKLDFLGGSGSLRNIYADKVEVYDNLIWEAFLDHPTEIADTIKNYALTFKNSGLWDNMKYWYTTDEPRSIDNFLPMHIVDSILNSVHCPHLITEIYPPWQVKINGDTLLKKFVEIAKPKKLMIDTFPFGEDADNTAGLESLRDRLQIAHSLQPGFWYVGQGFGEQDRQDSTIWHTWRKPSPVELNSSIMLALAHGVKGIMFWNYWSGLGHDFGTDIYYNCLVDTLINGNYQPTNIFFQIKNNLAPRLRGDLGERLLGLKYTGDYINEIYDEGPPPSPENMSNDYLSLQHYGFHYYWHIGFLYDSLHTDNRYFLMCNLKTNAAVQAKIYVTNPTNYSNFCIRDFEHHPGSLDTTVQTNATLYDSIPAGEGYLYQASPVIKYGGKLYYDEVINTNLTLYDDMTIENGVTLSVNATYECYANIITKGTGKIQTVNGGTIHFHNGKGIIVEGYPQILGTSSHKLTLDFGSTSEGTGIQILQGAQFIMNYCILKNSVNLVTAENSQFQTSINHCDFQNTSSYAISLSGASTRVPSIEYNTFSNTDYGIFSAGQSSITLNHNTFTDNKFAVNLSQIPDAEILFNTLTSSYGELPGIFLNSCGGNIRANTITGHSIGISLANSSPVIGDNDIYDNKINGMYVGAGSVPDLRGALVGNPPLVYPISGYNSIYENGGYNASGGEIQSDDGSEIYFNQSNIQLENGCNLIADDRTVSPPLITTLLLMNGSTTNRVNAIYNAWGDTVYPARFGTLTVNYSPYYEQPCLLPEMDGLAIQNKDGVVIDTVYSAGSPVNSPTALDLQYSVASQDMINLDFTSAETVYNSIISAAPAENTSQMAYTGLYKSARLRDADSTDLASLRELYNTNLEGITDTVMRKMVGQLSLLTLIDERQYNNAINGFGDIINQNPQTEEALFAEIDAMTTSLLAGNGNDTTLNKGLNKSLLVKGTADFQSRLNNLIQKKFGLESDGKKKEFIPTEYSLYNNYPNPFNPTTTIRFDIPERTRVELIVYDILGRKVRSLISNEVREPGRYEVSFNANTFASGVYIYKLTTKNYSQARKMLLIK